MTKAFMIYAVLLSGGDIDVDFKGYVSAEKASPASTQCIAEGEALLSSGQILYYECNDLPKQKSM